MNNIKIRILNPETVKTARDIGEERNSDAFGSTGRS